MVYILHGLGILESILVYFLWGLGSLSPIMVYTLHGLGSLASILVYILHGLLKLWILKVSYVGLNNKTAMKLRSVKSINKNFKC